MTVAPTHGHWLADLMGLAPRAVGISAATSIHDAYTAVALAAGLTETQLAARVAQHYGLPVAHLEQATATVLALIPEKVARQYTAAPLSTTDRHITIAVPDPNNLHMEQALGFASGRTPVFEIAPPGAILQLIDDICAPERFAERLVGGVGTEMSDQVVLIEEEEPEAVSSHEIDATPVVRLTNLILHEAVNLRASDIHLEPGIDGGTVRFRVDGVLRTIMKVPSSVLSRVIPRIKIMGKMDIADRLRPQDGRARLKVQDATLDLRISTVPTRDAEKAVIRLLDPRNARALEALEILAPELSRIRRLFGFREGIVVVTGPTGSGKTTLLYAALRELATGEVNIMTVEDPVEYELPGLTQIQVEVKRELTFASALRSVLRQDPDIVFIGEIRDRETAEVAVQASLTGHLVLTTLHANDAVGAVARFLDLGIDKSKIAVTLRGSVAQRLARRVCPECAEPITGSLTPGEARLAQRYDIQPVIRAVGCASCSMSGFRGRLPLLEVLISNPTFEQLVAEGATAAQLRATAATGGARSLRDNGIARVREGQTTLDEVARVLGDVGGEDEEATKPAPRILLVDDDPISRSIARSVLEKNGFRVAEAEHGAMALAMLGNGSGFALMVLDVDMPIMGGREVLARVRKAVTTAALPVLVLTGTSGDEAEIQLLEAGADDFIRKPLEPARFVTRVKAALRRAGG